MSICPLDDTVLGHTQWCDFWIFKGTIFAFKNTDLWMDSIDNI